MRMNFSLPLFHCATKFAEWIFMVQPEKKNNNNKIANSRNQPVLVVSKSAGGLGIECREKSRVCKKKSWQSFMQTPKLTYLLIFTFFSSLHCRSVWLVRRNIQHRKYYETMNETFHNQVWSSRWLDMCMRSDVSYHADCSDRYSKSLTDLLCVHI